MDTASNAGGSLSSGERVVVTVLTAPLYLYRWFLSPLVGATCRHEPTCSAYAMEAIRRYGAWRGAWLTVSRLARCNPWGSHGLDPVPREMPEQYGVFSAWRYGRWSGRHIAHGFHDPRSPSRVDGDSARRD